MVPMSPHKWVNPANGSGLLSLLDQKLWKGGLLILRRVASIVLSYGNG